MSFCTGTNVAKMLLSMCLVGCVRFARHCGKMYSRHLFSYGGLSYTGSRKEINESINYNFASFLSLQYSLIDLSLSATVFTTNKVLSTGNIVRSVSVITFKSTLDVRF